GGQIFIYRPSPAEGTDDEKNQPGTLTLYLEPNNTNLLEYGDNLTVAPWGDVVLSEDGANEQFLRGVTPNGEIYTLARSSYEGNSELCGVCFAPNHGTLFVNIQNPGITLAITGPWDDLTKV
ncbi:MAG: alkaline phosphatase PhoX, partial [Verrucomicrobiales bacterium]